MQVSSDVHEVVLDGHKVTYSLRVSSRARSASLSVRPEAGLVVTIPNSSSNFDLTALLNRHKKWIRTNIERVDIQLAALPRRWPYGNALFLNGEDCRVTMLQNPGKGRVSIDERGFRVYMPNPTINSARRLLRQWYKSHANIVINKRTEELAAHLGITWEKISIRDQKSRWGSCSAKGTLSFNYRIIMAPKEVMDYVVMHELLHRRILNHSKPFWALVAKHVPYYKGAISWLKTFGHCLTI